MNRIVPFFALALFALPTSAWAESAATDSELESGGLAPPPAVESDNSERPQTETEQELERADKEDSGRGLEFFWVNAEIGAEHLGLQTFKANNLVDAKVVPSKETGLIYGAGLGVRLLVFTLGAR